MSSWFSIKLCRFDFAGGVTEHRDLEQFQPTALMYHCTVIFIHLCY